MTAPTTWGQEFLLDQYLALAPAEWPRLAMPVRVAVLPGHDLEHVRHAVQATVAVNAALRVSYDLDRFEQRRHDRATVDVPVHHHDSADLAAAGGRPPQCDAVRALDVGGELPPIHACCDVVNGMPAFVNLSATHASLDAWGARRVRAQLGRYLADAAPRPHDTLDHNRIDTVARARFEHSEPGRRLNAESLEHLRERLASGFVPHYARGTGALADSAYHRAELDSPALLAAAWQAARRLRVPLQCTIFGVLAALLALDGGDEQTLLAVFVNNRFSAEDRSYPGALTQTGLVGFDAIAESAEATVRTAARALLQSASYARYSWRELGARDDPALTAACSATFNGLQTPTAVPVHAEASAAELAAMQSQSLLHLEPAGFTRENFLVSVVSNLDMHRAKVMVTFSDAVLSASYVCQLLHRIEAMMIDLSAGDRPLTA